MLTKFGRILAEQLRFPQGYDVFISYRVADSQPYCQNLAARLKDDFGFRCFIDTEGIVAGDEIMPRLKSVIRRSSLFVIVVTPGVKESIYVPQEIDSVPAGRAIVAINVDGTLEKFPQAPCWERIRGGRHLSERGAVVKKGAPGNEMVQSVQRALVVPRQRDQVARWLSIAVPVVMLLVTVPVGVVRQQWVRESADLKTAVGNLKGQVAELDGEKLRLTGDVKVLEKAERELKSAVEQEKKATKAAADAADRARSGERAARSAERNAHQSARLAQDEAREANAQAATARKDADAAFKAKIVAEASANRAVALRLAAEADVLRFQEPKALQRSLRLGFASLDRQPTREGWQAVRSAIELMPEIQESFLLPARPEAAVFSADGTRLATASFEPGTGRMVRIWDLQHHTSTVVGPIQRPVSSLAFGPIRRQLLVLSGSSGSRDERVLQAWDVEARSKLLEQAWTGGASIPLLSNGTARFSGNGKLLAAATGSHIRLWRGVDAGRGELPVSLPEAGRAVALDREGRWLAASLGRRIRLWSVAGGDGEIELQELAGSSQGTGLTSQEVVYDVQFSADGGHLIARTVRGLQVWSIPGCQRVSSHTTPSGSPGKPMLFVRGRAVAAISADSVQYWSNGVSSAAPPGEVVGHSTRHGFVNGMFVNSVDIGAKDTLLTASDDGTARVWHFRRERARMTHDSAVLAAAFARDGASIWTVSQDSSVRRWNAGVRPEAGRVDFTGPQTRHHAVSPGDGRFAASADHNTRESPELWDTAAGEPLPRPQGLLNLSIGVMGFSPDQRHLAAASGSQVWVWEANGDWSHAGARVLARLDHPDRVQALAFGARDSRNLVTATESVVRVWRNWNQRSRSSTPYREFRLAARIASLTVSPDGERVAAATENGTLHLLGIEDRASFEVKVEHAMGSVAFSGDGRYLAAGDEKGFAHVWHFKNGRLTLQHSLRHEVTRRPAPCVVALNEDGTILATALRNTGSPARVWNWRAKEEPELMQADDLGWIESIAFRTRAEGPCLVTVTHEHLRFWNITRDGIKRSTNRRLAAELPPVDAGKRPRE